MARRGKALVFDCCVAFCSFFWGVFCCSEKTVTLSIYRNKFWFNLRQTFHKMKPSYLDPISNCMQKRGEGDRLCAGARKPKGFRVMLAIFAFRNRRKTNGNDWNQSTNSTSFEDCFDQDQLFEEG
jgi:hypothetical protein